jgi:hypothetical protein
MRVRRIVAAGVVLSVLAVPSSAMLGSVGKLMMPGQLQANPVLSHAIVTEAGITITTEAGDPIRTETDTP